METFLHFRKLNFTSLLTIPLFMVISGVSILVLDRPIYTLLLTVLCLLFIFSQLAIIGYKVDKSKIDEQSLSKSKTNTITILYDFPFEESLNNKTDDNYIYLYNESMILEDVYSIFSIFRLKRLKMEIEEMIKLSTSKI